MYQIETTFNNEPVTFCVVVAQDESEIDDLVQFHLNYLNNPTPASANLEPLTPQQKLANLGLTVEDLKTLLG